ncbi:N-6 DNA methylase [Levilactobacillus spicheri]|nr:N-6 DNA methylase [Levilactobacillus spicheri]GEO68050.1 hypothetical protein LSP04_24690 [Levilactobacillus spicheri]
MKFTSEKVNELLGVDEAFKVPDKLMLIMMNREKREQTFKKFLEVERDTSFDWFHEYFESEQAERKTKKQDFTPDSVSDIMAGIVGNADTYFESAAGTGGIAIRHWRHDLIENHNPFSYEPSDDFMVLEEKSERALPFLLFNLSIRGINAIVIHGDSLSREVNNVYYLLNDKNDFLAFSTVNVMPQNRTTMAEFNVSRYIDSPIDHIEADINMWRDNVGNKYDFAAKFIEKYSKLKGISHYDTRTD